MNNSFEQVNGKGIKEGAINLRREARYPLKSV